MRKFKTRRTHALPFRLLLLVAGALLLTAAFAPSAKAQALIAYFNFEDSTLGGAPDFASDVPPGGVSTTITTNYTAADMSSVAGLTLNQWPTDPDPQVLGLGLTRTDRNNGAHFDINLGASSLFSNMTVSFGTENHGNGFTNVQLFYNRTGPGGTFVAGPTAVMPNSGIVTLTVPAGANNAPNLVLRLLFTAGGPGNDLQTVIDNIRVEGSVPEPATVAGGLLGLLGLCWFQRKRLIYSVRFRRT